MYKVVINGMLVFIVSLLSACGGGGGSGGGTTGGTTGGTAGGATGGSSLSPISDMSLAELIGDADLDADSFYDENSDAANITSNNISDILYSIFGAPSSAGSTGSKVSKTAPENTALQHLKMTAMARNYLVSAVNQTVLPNAKTTNSFIPLNSKIDVDDTLECDQGQGDVRYFGSLSDAATGALEFSYNSCLVGIYRFNGTGAIYVDRDLTTHIFFSGVTVTTDNYSAEIHGYEIIASSFGAQDISNLTVSDSFIGAKIRYIDFSNTFANGGSGQISGKMFHGIYGAMEITTPQQLYFSTGEIFSNGELRVFSENGSEALLEANNYGIKVFTDRSSSGEFQSGIAISGGDLSRINSSDFVAFDQVDFPAEIWDAEIIIEYADAEEIFDYPMAHVGFSFQDYESTSFSFDFVWTINGVVSTASDSQEFPAGFASRGDVLGATVSFFDGFSTAEDSATAIVPDAPGSLRPVSMPSLFTPESIEIFSVLISDVDDQDDGGVPVLIDGPSGFTFSATGEARWDVPRPIVAGVSYSATFEVPISLERRSIPLPVSTADDAAPISRSGISAQDGIAAEWLNPDETSLIFINQTSIFSMVESGGKYLQNWAITFVDEMAGFEKIFSAELDSDSLDELVVMIGQGSFYWLENADIPLQFLWSLEALGFDDPSRSIRHVQVHDLGDGQGVRAFVIVDQFGSSGPQLIIVDLVSGELLFQLDQFYEEEIFIGNVDSDSILEVLLPDGTYINTESYGLGSQIDDSLGPIRALVDVDGDQVKEIIYWGNYREIADSDDPLAAYSVISDEMLWQESIGSACDIFGANTDADAQEELIAYCSSSFVRAIDGSSPLGLVTEITFSTLTPGNNQLLVADVTGDDVDELIGFGNDPHVTSFVDPLGTASSVLVENLDSWDGFSDPNFKFDVDSTSVTYLGWRSDNLLIQEFELTDAGDISGGPEHFLQYASDKALFYLDLETENELRLVQVEVDGDLRVVELFDPQVATLDNEIGLPLSTIPEAKLSDINDDGNSELVYIHYPSVSDPFSQSYLIRENYFIEAYDMENEAVLWSLEMPEPFMDFLPYKSASGEQNLLMSARESVELWTNLDSQPQMQISLQIGCQMLEHIQVGSSGRIICVENNGGPDGSDMVHVFSESLSLISSTEFENIIRDLEHYVRDGDENYLVLAQELGFERSVLNFVLIENDVLSSEFSSLPMAGGIQRGDMEIGTNPNTEESFLAIGIDQSWGRSTSVNSFHLLPLN